ncbi:hypothetical protein VHEMI04866 [[Torrubiella] hemipterigena]|uniref:GST N-terminal domain-containing protein n=1 Tax=[Torrubiella] hemipterigena TaxID=1531966 RepID=A0A0A1T2G3_9HYPO|nr:hypothetical protein VHEMI04866 [[Torrubiella] hemipterigena]
MAQSEGALPELPQAYTLHVFPFSLYSIMARFTYVLARSTKSPVGNDIVFENKLVNLHHDENISEDYLVHINPKGQVPALTGASLDTPLTDSLEISYWICERYPKMLPSSFEKQIREALKELHRIKAICLSVPKEDHGERIPCPAVDDLLAKNDISNEYRAALTFKREFHRGRLEFSLIERRIVRAETRANKFFETILYFHENRPHNSVWLFNGPTVLDAHVVPFILRLMENGRVDMIPETLQRYAKDIQKLDVWNQVMHGRPTLWNPSIGHVRDLNPF